MLKLRYLFDNRDLAIMILENWEYDPASLHMLDYFRISSNATYPFEYEGKRRFLRFAPCTEKDKSNILGELDFVRYLKKRGYPVLSTVPSKNNRELLEVNTPWGKYYAVVFESVAGVRLDQTDYSYDMCKKHGRILGRLHKLSSEYKPSKALRWSHKDVFSWIEKELSHLPDEDSARQEAKLLNEFFSKLPCNDQIYGLVHYDFELDNIFYDQTTDTLNVIDFDDSMYHWYVLDIVQALDNIAEEISCEDFSLMRDCFIKGYREEFSVSDEMLSYLPAFKRFIDLYGYVRTLVATKEAWDNEPKWMTNLRMHLTSLMEDRSRNFGQPII